MTKKEYVLTLLHALEASRPVARGLRVLVEHNTLDDMTIDSLTDMFKSAVSTVDASITKQKLAQSVAVMQKIKQAERAEQQKDNQDLQHLEQMIQTI